MKVPRRSALLVAALLLAGCNDGSSDADPTATPDETATTADATEPTSGATDGEDSPSPDGETETSQALQTVQVGEEREQDGVVITVDTIEVGSDRVFVNLTAFNGATQDAVLATSEDVVLMYDDKLRQLAFRPPSDNPTLRLAPGEELTARLGFVGRLSQDPQYVSVWFNHEDQTTPVESREDVLVVTPTFTRMELP